MREESPVNTKLVKTNLSAECRKGEKEEITTDGVTRSEKNGAENVLNDDFVSCIRRETSRT